MTFAITRRLVLATAAGLALTAAAATPGWAETTTLTFLVDNAPNTVAWANQLKADFEAKNPDIKIEIETRPGGSDGDNIVKTRLATSDMDDVFLYNSGSLFQAINPEQNLVDLTNEPWQADVLSSFKQVVTARDGTIHGAPIGAAMGGGVLYNKPIYKQLGLSVPKTWDEFMANNEKIKAAGKAPVIQTFEDDLDQPALRARRLLQRLQAAVPTSPTGIHGQQGALCRHAGGTQGLPAPGGRLQGRAISIRISPRQPLRRA